MRHLPRIIIVICLFCQSAYSQVSKTDSLRSLLKNQNSDSVRATLLQQILYAEQHEHNYKSAFETAKEALLYAKKVNYKPLTAAIYNSLGICYYDTGNYPEALKNYFEASKLWGEVGDKVQNAAVYNNIGIVYNSSGQYDEAMKNHNKALQLRLETGNLNEQHFSYTNIGATYENMSMHEEALKNYSLALEIQLRIKDEGAIANSYNNMAVVLAELNKYDEAFDNYLRCRAIQEKKEDKFGMSVSNFNIGDVLLAQKKYKEALTYSLKALEPSKELGMLDLTQAIEFNLSQIYSGLKDHRSALKHYKAYIGVRDSIFNEENTKKTVQAEMNFEFEKKEAAAKLEEEKKEAIALAESKKQKVIILSVCGILILVVFFAIYAFWSFLQKKKANVEISRQKEIIEEKQKEIVDSIYYARRIQQALITNERYINKSLTRLGSEKKN